MVETPRPQALAEGQFIDPESLKGPFVQKCILVISWITFVLLSAFWVAIGTPVWVWLLLKAWTRCIIGNLVHNLTGRGVAAEMELMNHAIPFWFAGFVTAKKIAFGNPQLLAQPVDAPWQRLVVDSVCTLAFWAITLWGIPGLTSGILGGFMQQPGPPGP